jgi:hypothetical protein
MERNQIELTRSSADQQSDHMVADQIDLELASAYAANSEMSLEILEEFAAVDQEGF